MKILLDMDGVVADFVEGAARLYGTTRAELEKRWPAGDYDALPELLEDEMFWNRIRAQNEEFWRTLPLMPEAKKIYRMCSRFGNIVFCTISINYSSAIGKIKWLEKHFSGNRYMILSNPLFKKDFNKTRILIDDCDGQYPNILYPQVWNSAGKMGVKRKLEYLQKELRKWIH